MAEWKQNCELGISCIFSTDHSYRNRNSVAQIKATAKSLHVTANLESVSFELIISKGCVAVRPLQLALIKTTAKSLHLTVTLCQLYLLNRWTGRLPLLAGNKQHRWRQVTASWWEFCMGSYQKQLRQLGNTGSAFIKWSRGIFDLAVLRW